MIHIIIADDHLLFIDGLKALLKSEAEITVVDEAHNGKELLNIMKATPADMVLLDINMPQMNGLDAARRIRLLYPHVKIIMLSTYSETHLVKKAMQSGANGYLLKNSSKNELIHTIRSVACGNQYFPAYDAEKNYQTGITDNFLKQFNLTKREVELLHLIKRGLTNQQIAEQLFLSIYTVETHRKNIMQKLGLNGPSALMKFIVENGV